MAMLQVPELSTKSFTWTGRTGVCEASDLGRAEIGGRIYDDACDYGFALRSEKTGVVLLMAETTPDVREGEVLACRFKSIGVLPAGGRPRLIRGLVPEVEVVVLND
jgi:hypothetical protein